MPSLPQPLALTTPADNSLLRADDPRSDYAAIQTFHNSLVTTLGGGTVGQILTGNGSVLTWRGYPTIFDTTVAAAAATIDVLGIPATFKHLMVMCQARGNVSSPSTNLLLRLNNDSAANYDWQLCSAAAAVATAAEAFAQTSIVAGVIAAANAAAGLTGISVISLPDYASTTFNKIADIDFHYKISTVSGNVTVGRSGGHWRNTAAVNRITLLPAAGFFDVGTRVTVYGI
jgi:hypothetical protein